MDNREWISELNPDDAVVIFVVKADEKEDIVPGVVEDLDDDGIVVSGIKFNYEGFVGDEECTYKLVKFDDLNYKGKKIYHYHKMEADLSYKEKMFDVSLEITMSYIDWRELLNYFGNKEFLIAAFKNKYDVEPRHLRDVALYISDAISEVKKDELEDGETLGNVILSITMRVEDWLLVYEVLIAAGIVLNEKLNKFKRDFVREKYMAELRQANGLIKWLNKIFDVKINDVK